ncbi:unannotated protein [freshwater metagenome]|uniref:Unannotated protein n=1 Tax=freshwater metagenome TaxID=449393 RepID=A0A6J7GDY3_9ZZZZ
MAGVLLIGGGYSTSSLQSASAATLVPSPTASTLPAPNLTAVTPTANPTPTSTHRPKPASRTKKAKWIPVYPNDLLHAGTKRVVYDKALMTVWLIKADNTVMGQFPVVGRWDRPKAGTYHVFSKSTKAYNPNSKVTFNHMVRFTYGPDTKSPIGLHSIPRYYDGKLMHSVKQLGLAIARGGCVRLSEQGAAQVYKFAHVGTLIVVLPSP